MSLAIKSKTSLFLISNDSSMGRHTLTMTKMRLCLGVVQTNY